jgi:chorismate dehydratase
MITGKADIGSIPVASLPQVKNYDIIGNYCIGANGKVRTVMLFCNCPFEDVTTVNLDYRSKSSVNLTRVLAKRMWNREFNWKDTSEGFDFVNPGKNEAMVLIGDQCFESENKFRFKIDLALEWNRYTGLPFVFAVWASNRSLDDKFKLEFNEALKLGVDNLHKVAKAFSGTSVIKEDELETYLRTNIDYPFDDKKREGMNLFLKLLAEL